ncbi:hypothetical protein [Gordonia sp. NPDC003585]|uniref:hypothetical protein n=1 Tax=Gordonia sp. NPDC003585 TaxID=3154275 RepID=UPI0033A270B8
MTSTPDRVVPLWKLHIPTLGDVYGEPLTLAELRDALTERGHSAYVYRRDRSGVWVTV